jgi:predicted PurR-regulated permease PerM
LQASPALESLVTQIDQRIDLPGTVKSFTGWLISRAGLIVKGSVFQLVDFMLTFYLLFFFLRDRRAALQMIKSLSPLRPSEMNRLFHRVGDTIVATIYGTLVVSALQGLLGGLMFWWLGLPAPLLWGTVMGVLALVPVLGAFVVWLPAALFLVMDGSWGQALVLTLWGLLVVGTIDNLLRPILVGNRMKLPTVLAFISVLGGLLQFGAAGLILGPAILAVTTVLLEIWSGRAQVETSSHSRDEDSSHSRTLWRAAAPVSGQPAQAPSDLLGAGADQRRVFGEEGPVDLHEAAGGEVME